MISLRPLPSRLVAVLLLLLAITGAVAAILWPLGTEIASTQRHATSLMQQLEHTRRVIQNRSLLRQRLAQLKRMDLGGSYYLHGDTPALATARLQEHLKQLVEQQGGTLISAQTLPAKEVDGAVSVGLKVHMTASLDALLRVCHTLEMGRPMLFTNSIAITVNPSVRAANPEHPAPQFLDARIELVGYMRRATS